LLNRLTDWSQRLEKVNKNQFGFQKGKSIIDCMFVLHSIITKVLNSKEKLYCIFIDYELCFDKIDRSFLWQKLLQQRTSSKIVKALQSMYTTVKSCIRFKGTYSPFFESHIGLKQGDPSSPLLFMLFVNDITENINTNLEGIFTINEIKIFLLLFADDQVLFAKSPETLQQMLTDVENYCQAWGLKINTSKTKAMIFENGRSTFNFYIYGTAIEVVESFKYLGLTFYKNGNFLRSQRVIAQHASIALYNLFTIFKEIELPITRKCYLFDTLVGSILNFSAEIWGMHSATDIEMVHTKFLRRILGVRKSTNLTALYGELGRIPYFIRRKIIMIKYWLKILKQNSTELPKIMYTLLKEDCDRGQIPNGRNWALNIKNILNNLGLSYIWENQFDIYIPFDTIKQRILDNYLQSWYSEINNSSRLKTYNHYI
jgi:hypothetical protein